MANLAQLLTDTAARYGDRPALQVDEAVVTYEQFDDAAQVIGSTGLPVFYVPGEHDVIDEGLGKSYLARYGKASSGSGWYSFDQNGVHFIGLVNVAKLKPGGLGQLGPDQLAWLEEDLRAVAKSTPIVVFAHIPLWTIYPQWGWGTEDSGRALELLRPYGSVTVLRHSGRRTRRRTWHARLTARST